MKSSFEVFQSLGRALMLPIAVLPVAGLLLRLGQPDVFALPFIAAAGDAIFSNLGLLFAVGVAVGLAKENHGAAGLAGVVCFLIATTGAKAIMAVPPEALAGFGDAARDLAAEAFKAKAIAKLGVPTGILSGLIAGAFYNRFHAIKLPEYLAFFGGRRFVPIAAGLAALVLAAALGWGWTYISAAVDGLSLAVVRAGSFGLFAYGVLNRLLIVTGLHHILNNITWFILGDFHGVTGDLNRFMAGDPTAGAFMAGYFPVMMFGLPAACLAMYHAVPADRRKAAGGALLSMALTAFLTGVTEPIEFSFMFLAPALYAIHAVLTGLSMTLMSLLGVKLGFSFSAGLFDYVLNFSHASRPLLLVPVGAVYFALYYAIFRFVIVKFDLKTLGREDEPVPEVAPGEISDRGRAFAEALGGSANLRGVDACTTRLRLNVTSSHRLDEARLRALGARGIVRPSETAAQVVLGPIADQVAGEIREALAADSAIPASAGAASAVPDAPKADTQVREVPADPVLARKLLAALGGAENLRAVSVCSSRLCVSLADDGAVDVTGLRAEGVRGVACVPHGVQIILGPQAPAMQKLLCAKA